MHFQHILLSITMANKVCITDLKVIKLTGDAAIGSNNKVA